MTGLDRFVFLDKTASSDDIYKGFSMLFEALMVVLYDELNAVATKKHRYRCKGREKDWDYCPLASASADRVVSFMGDFPDNDYGEFFHRSFQSWRDKYLGFIIHQSIYTQVHPSDLVMATMLSRRLGIDTDLSPYGTPATVWMDKMRVD